MKVNKLTLSNFRSFRHLDIALDDHLNVFVGDNGTGKTNVLDSLTIHLSRFIANMCYAPRTGRAYTKLDVNSDCCETTNTIAITSQNASASWVLCKAVKGQKIQVPSDLSGLQKFVVLLHNNLEKNDDASIPIVVHYCVNRDVQGLSLKKIQNFSICQLDAYDQCLTGKPTDFRLFFEWFRNRTDLESELQSSGLSIDLSQIQTVRDAINAVTGFANIRFKKKPLRIEIFKQECCLNFSQLSGGERCLVALVGDLARRLVIANPDLANPLKGTGIVLIDEIELHLHPELQRQIIPKLKQTFPNCQFVITTNSPLVLSHIPGKCVWKLMQKDGETRVVQPESTYGHDVNYLLATVFDTAYRPKEIDDELHRLFKQIKTEPDAARALLADLRVKIDGASPDLVKAEALLRRYEIIGK